MRIKRILVIKYFLQVLLVVKINKFSSDSSNFCWSCLYLVYFLPEISNKFIFLIFFSTYILTNTVLCDNKITGGRCLWNLLL
jgi:hypothetical protein